MATTVEYQIGLRDAFSAIAEKIGRATGALDKIMKALGTSTNTTESALNRLKVPPALAGITKEATAAQKAVAGVAQAFNKLAQQPPTLGARHLIPQRAAEAEAMRKAMEQPALAAGSSKGGRMLPKGVHTGMGFMALMGLGHNEVFSDWKEFDEQMRLTRGTLAGQASEEQIQELRRQAQEISKGSRFTPAEVAKLFQTQASRGIDAKDMPTIARQMMGLATGTGESMDQTFDTHLAIQRGFELPLSSFPHISDTIARVHQKTGIGLNQIQTQMGQISAFAHQAGWTEEQTVATLGLLAKRGMGQYAGSGMARLISKSLNWSKPAAAFWEGLGISKEQVIDPKTGGMLNPADMLDLLKAKTKGMRSADVAAAFSKMFGDRGVKVAAALANSDPKELREAIADLEHIEGLAELMGVEGAKGASAGVANLTASIQRLKTSIGESGFGEQVGALANKFAGWADALAGSSAGTRQAAGWIAMLGNVLSAAAMPLMAASILLPVLGSGLMLVARITGLAAVARGIMAIASASGVLAALSGPLGAVLATLTALYALSNTPEKAKDLLERDKEAGRRAKQGLANLQRLLGFGGDEAPVPPGAGASKGGGYLGGLSDAARNVAKSSMDKMRVEVDVKAPPAININVDVKGDGGQSGRGSGSLPLSATAPRGTTMATPPSPPVPR